MFYFRRPILWVLCFSGSMSSDYSVIIIVWCLISINKLIDRSIYWLIDWLISLTQLQPILFHPSRSAEYCDGRVCLFMCLSFRKHISGNTRPIFASFWCVSTIHGRGSVLLWRRCDALCRLQLFGCWDGVVFARTAGLVNKWSEAGVYSKWLNRGQRGFDTAAYT